MQQDETQMDLVGRVIGAAIEVHSILGAGFQEITYERALGIELRRRGIAFRRQVQVELTYKGESLGDGAVDMLVEDELVVELKAITSLTDLTPGRFLPTCTRRVSILASSSTSTKLASWTA